MIFEIKTSPINGEEYMVFDPYRDEVYDIHEMLNDAFPNQGYCVVCFGGYDNGISFHQQFCKHPQWNETKTLTNVS